MDNRQGNGACPDLVDKKGESPGSVSIQKIDTPGIPLFLLLIEAPAAPVKERWMKQGLYITHWSLWLRSVVMACLFCLASAPSAWPDDTPATGDDTVMEVTVSAEEDAVEGEPAEETGETGPDTVTLDTMVVTSHEVAENFETGDVDLEQTPAFYTVIRRDAFEGKMTCLSDVIEKEAGIQIRQSGGLGSFSSVSLRGSTGEQVMIYLDGVLLNDASGGGVDLSNISLSDVASIEIFKGTAPIQFGKPAIGGVVNIKTLRAKDGVRGNVTTGYGSFNTWQTSGLVNYKKGQWDGLVSGEYMDSDNDFNYLNKQGTLWSDADDTWEDRENSQVAQANVLGKVGLDISPDTRLSLVNQWFQKDQGIANWRNSPANDTTLDTRRNITTLKLTLDDVTAAHLNTVWRLDTTWMEEEYKDLKGHVGLGRQHTQNVTRKYGINAFAEWPADWHILTATADIRLEQYKPEDLTGQALDRDSDRTLVTLGLEDTVFFFNDRLSVSPALRFMVIDNHLQSGTSVHGMAVDEVNDSESHWTPQIGVKIKVFPWLTLKSNLNRYVREPSFFELFGDRGFFTGNQELMAEKGVNRDIGFEAAWDFEERPVQSLSFSLAWFKNDVDDLITRVYDARGIGKSDNISGSEISGVEAGFRLRFKAFLTLSGGLTLQDTENQSEIASFDGKDLPGRYATSWMGKAEFRYRDALAYVEYLADRDMYYDTANLLKAANKEVVNIGGSYLFTPHWRIFLEARNIRDHYYEDFYRYPMPGRSFSASVKYMF